jgi:large subunit ribosomal protein L18
MSASNKNLALRRAKRNRYNLRKKAGGKPRLSVFRSACNIYAQVIDDLNGITLVAASTVEKEWAGKKAKSNIEAAKKIGALVAKRLLEKNIAEVVFDKGPYLYHGKVKALADAAREAGLKF